MVKFSPASHLDYPSDYPENLQCKNHQADGYRYLDCWKERAPEQPSDKTENKIKLILLKENSKEVDIVGRSMDSYSLILFF
jgi:hypothetical protein